MLFAVIAGSSIAGQFPCAGVYSTMFNACSRGFRAGTGLCGIVLLTVLAGTGPAAVQAAKDKKKPSIPQVIVAPVSIGIVSDRVEALGTAQANESVVLSANVSEKVKAIHFQDGQQVRAGEVLVVLEQAEELANLEQAKALLSERQLALTRYQKLEKGRLTAADVIDRTRFEVQQARASISAIQARIDDRTVRAPFAGIVGLRHISVGGLVEAGSAVLTLDDTSLIKLDFTVPEVFLPELRPGLKIEARAAALGLDHIYYGELKSIDSRVDPATRSLQVRALLPNSEGRIVPGILMQVDLLRNTRQAPVIPEAALLPQGEKQFVMVRAQKDGKDVANRKLVQIGARLAGRVEVVSGLQAGEQVLTHGNNKARPGGEIKVLAVDDGSQDISAIIKGKTLERQ